jgi:hypothetical protein
MRSLLLLMVPLLLLGCMGPSGQPVADNGSEDGGMEARLNESAPIMETDASEAEAALPGAGQALITQVLASYNDSDMSSFSNVNLLLESEVDDILPLFDSDDAYANWTALYVLSNIAWDTDDTEKARLKEKIIPFIDGNISSFKFLAGATLITMGDVDGIPVLIESLSANELLALSEPPILVCDYANVFLVRYTEEDFGFTCGVGGIDEAARDDWSRWWSENNGSISWDASEGRMVVP